MKPWRESIRLKLSPRDVRVAGIGPLLTRLDGLLSEHGRAAFEHGRAEGERLLSEQLVRQRADVLDLQNGVLEALRGTVPQVRRETEKTVAALALEIARKLVTELPITGEMVEGAVREAMDQLEDATEFTVFLHPDDLELMRQMNSPILLPQGSPDRIRFLPSQEVSRGGCLLQTRFGVIDARRETKIEMMREALRV